MFDIGWSELLVIGIVALVVIGPKELPTVLRTVGQWVGKIRRMAGEFQGQFQDAMREAEMADLKKTFDPEQTVKDYGLDFSAVGNIKQDMEKAVGDLPASATDMTATRPADPAATGTGPVAPEPPATTAPVEPAPAAEPAPPAEPRNVPTTVAELEASRAAQSSQAPRGAVAEPNPAAPSVTAEKQPS